MPHIEWLKKYETTIDIIDEQHKGLVDLINNLRIANEENRGKEILRETIFKLVEYTKIHFNDEEKHMQKNYYPS